MTRQMIGESFQFPFENIFFRLKFIYQAHYFPVYQSFQNLPVVQAAFNFEYIKEILALNLKGHSNLKNEKLTWKF